MGQTGTLDKAATAAGRLILEALGEERPARSLSRLSDSPRAVRLLRELFTVAVRRSFVGRESRDVTRYVRDLLEYQSLPAGGELAREAEAMIRGAIGEPELPPGVPGAELFALVDQAEQRVARFDRPRNRVVGRRSM